MTSDLLPDLLTTHRPAFEALAAAWLSGGAASFSVWTGHEALECWPKGFEATEGALVSPVEVDGHIVGEIRAAVTATPRAQERLRADARLIGSLVPLARDLSHVTGELIETRDQLLALYQLTRSCRNCLTIDEILNKLASQIPLLASTQGSFLLLNAGSKNPFAAQYPADLFTPAELESIAQNVDKKSARIVSHAGGQILLAPLLVNEGGSSAPRGIIGLVNKLTGEFQSPDIKLAEALASQSAAQIENVLLVQSQLQLTRFQTEMELAQKVQVSLLPKEPPRLPGIEIWAATHPALHVGGDFFDFIMKPGWPFLFVVGDLSGKGFPAALLMSMTRTVIRTAIHGASTPEKILSDTNNELYDDFNQLNSFATLFIGQYYPERREVLYANAGHSPVIYRPLGESPRLLFADGTPLGILSISQSRDQCLTLRKGDLLLVGSDGLTDAENDSGQRFGYERLISLVDSIADKRPAEMAAQIFQEVAGFSSHALPFDDQTLVILQCTGD